MRGDRTRQTSVFPLFQSNLTSGSFRACCVVLSDVRFEIRSLCQRNSSNSGEHLCQASHPTVLLVQTCFYCSLSGTCQTCGSRKARYCTNFWCFLVLLSQCLSIVLSGKISISKPYKPKGECSDLNPSKGSFTAAGWGATKMVLYSWHWVNSRNELAGRPRNSLLTKFHCRRAPCFLGRAVSRPRSTRCERRSRPPRLFLRIFVLVAVDVEWW